jgi:hypothetical protein
MVRYYLDPERSAARSIERARSSYDGELSPAQWMALRFFARANPFSRTPSAFAEFQATTRGTATQAIKALEAGGYLVRQPFKTDGRSVSLRLTVLVSIVHSASMIAAGGFSAWLVYRYLGLKFISRSWFNLDATWAVSLILVGTLALAISLAD